MININEIIQDNEMEQLLIIGESFNKQLLLNDIYMEEDSSNNIKGVNCQHTFIFIFRGRLY